MSLPVAWHTSPAPVAYPAAVAAMEARVAAIRAGKAGEAVWFLEHPPLYTAGTSALPEDLLAPHRFPVYRTGRGGQYTYHGPGQRVVYVMLDLGRRGRDIRAFVADLEGWLIGALADLGVVGVRRSGRIGIWVPGAPGGEAKIAALGIRVRHWVSFHGVALNVACDLEHFTGIVPCGLAGHGVTSLAALGRSAAPGEVDRVLATGFARRFGCTLDRAGDFPGAEPHCEA